MLNAYIHTLHKHYGYQYLHVVNKYEFIKLSNLGRINNDIFIGLYICKLLLLFYFHSIPHRITSLTEVCG